MAEIPTPDLAVPYAAPKQVKTIADVQPMAPKKGCRDLLAYYSQPERHRRARCQDECWRHRFRLDRR